MTRKNVEIEEAEESFFIDRDATRGLECAFAANDVRNVLVSRNSELDSDPFDAYLSKCLQRLFELECIATGKFIGPNTRGEKSPLINR